MDDDTIKALFAMGCITLLEGIAMLMGMNGLMLMTALMALGTIAGYEIKSVLIKRKE